MGETLNVIYIWNHPSPSILIQIRGNSGGTQRSFGLPSEDSEDLEAAGRVRIRRAPWYGGRSEAQPLNLAQQRSLESWDFSRQDLRKEYI